MVVRMPSAMPHDVVGRNALACVGRSGRADRERGRPLAGRGRAAPALDHDNAHPTWSRHVDLHSINDRTHDQQAAAAVGAAAGNRNQTWIKARALVTDLQPAPGVIEVYAYP